MVRCIELIHALEEHMHKIETPIRSHVRSHALLSERHSARRIIQQREVETFHKKVDNRREVRKGKRVILKGKFKMRSGELLDDVKNAETESSEKQHSKRRKTIKKDTFDAELTISDGEKTEEEDDNEIQDCILVAVE